MSDYKRIRTPFTNMSFTPDVPSNALGPLEYNSGKNIEADVRGIKKVFGEQEILSTITDKIIFVDGGFRSETTWVYIVATRNSSNQGKWWMITSYGISNITPGVGSNPSVYLSGYTDDLNITTSWVGSVFFINDTLNNPMYFLPTSNEITITTDAAWNYNPAANKTTAGFVRNYCSPNVGNILIAGNLTETNIANEQEVPVRGPLIDGFFLGGNFYVCSYWDTVVFTPIAYQSSVAPIFGVRLLNQGRGLLNNNCSTNTDAYVYGIDSRDIWVFDGANFNSIGNQKIKDYFFNNLNPIYDDRVFMVNNTQKYQIEIYYPDLTSGGWCNKMISYRYDLQIWNAPKDVMNACMGTEGPKFASGSFQLASRTVVYAQGGTSFTKLIQTNVGNSFVSSAIDAKFERNNMLLPDNDGAVPYSSKVYVHRVLPEISGTGKVNITIGGANSTAQTPQYGQVGTTDINTNTPWVTTQQQAVRTISVKVESNDATDTWNMTALNWQATIVEDAF